VPAADVPPYCAEVEILRDLNARHRHMTPEALAEWLVADLVRAKAIAREGGDIVPLVGAYARAQVTWRASPRPRPSCGR